MLEHYQQLISTNLDSYMEQRFRDYLQEGDRSILAELPNITAELEQLANCHTLLYYAHNFEEGLSLFWNYLQLIYERGSSEHYCYLIYAFSRSWWWRDDRLTDRLFDSASSSPRQITELQLYLLFESTKYEDMLNVKPALLKTLASQPQLFEEVLAENQRSIRWMSMSLLYSSDPARFEPIFAGIIAKISDDDHDWLMPLAIAAASNGYSSASLNAKLASMWRKSPYQTSYSIIYRDFHHPDALPLHQSDDTSPNARDKSSNDFTKRLDYLSDAAKQLRIEDELLMLGGYYNLLDADEIDILITFVSRFSQDTLLGLAEMVCIDPQTSPNYLLHIWRLLRRMQLPTDSLSDIFRRQYDQQIESAFTKLDKKTAKGELPAQKSEHENEINNEFALFIDAARRWLRDGDAEALAQIVPSAKYDSAQYEFQAELRLIAALAGRHLQDEALEERVARLARLLIQLRDRYNLSSFIWNATIIHQWHAKQGLDYLFSLLSSTEEELDLLEFLFYPLKESQHQFSEEGLVIMREAALEYLLGHESETLAYLNSRSNDCGLLNAYYQNNPDADPLPLLTLLEVRNKALRNHVLKLIVNYPQTEAGLEELRRHSRKDVREYADKALAALAGINANVLPADKKEQTATDASFDMKSFVEQNYGRAEAKRLAFTQPEQWPLVRWADSSQPVDDDSVCCYVALYLESKEIARLYSGEKMRPFFNEDDMHRLAVYLFNIWKDEGAEAKFKGAMTLYAIHGGESAINSLKSLINDFAEAGRSAMVKDVLRAIAASQTNLALATIDNLSKKSKNKSLRKQAANIISEIASLLGLTLEELSDRIVPTLGLNERGELQLSTGGGDKDGRNFTAVLQDDLSIRLMNSEGKTLRSLPAFSEKNDDRAAYDRAKAELSMLRKELKPLVRTQTKRLEISLFESFTWNREQFLERFIANPIMQRFAMTLVFSVYRDNELLSSFRYAGDGSFSDSNDEEFELPDEAHIRLAHPAEFSVEELQAWQEQFDDYEIQQPFSQLHRTVYRPENGQPAVSNEFRDKKFGNFTLGRLVKESWYGDDASSYDGYTQLYCSDKPSGITACLSFQGRAYLWDQNAESCVIDTFFFINTADLDRSVNNPRAMEKNALPLEQVPVRFYSEVLLTLRQITE